MSSVVTAGGIVVERWDDDTRLYTRTAVDGTLLEQRPYTTAESAGLDAIVAVNLTRQRRQTLIDALAVALSTDLDYLALTAPTVLQQATQVDVLTRQMVRLIRLATNRLT